LGHTALQIYVLLCDPFALHFVLSNGQKNKDWIFFEAQQQINDQSFVGVFKN